MKKILIISLILIPVVVVGAWFEPTSSVRGWLRGEPFFANRSVSYWERKLASQDPVDQAQIPKQLQDAAAVPVLGELLTASDSSVRYQVADILGKIGPPAAEAARNWCPH